MTQRLPIIGSILALFLAGCASTSEPLYGWGSYQNQVYVNLKGGTAPDAQIKELEENEQKIRSSGLALPPGYLAHLAMLYGETGQSDKARELLEKEKASFPESAVFIDFLLSQLR